MREHRPEAKCPVSPWAATPRKMALPFLSRLMAKEISIYYMLGNFPCFILFTHKFSMHKMEIMMLPLLISRGYFWILKEICKSGKIIYMVFGGCFCIYGLTNVVVKAEVSSQQILTHVQVKKNHRIIPTIIFPSGNHKGLKLISLCKGDRLNSPL